MRETYSEPVRVPLAATAAAHRRRRLKRGVARWRFEIDLRRSRLKRVLLLTFTLARGQRERAEGQIRAFWHAVRDSYGVQTYFTWLELQADGTPHYHAFWVNPPWHQHLNMRARLRQWWPHGRTNFKILDSHAFERRGIEYVTGYVKKQGPKAHQQQYERLDVPLRTFTMQRGVVSAVELEQHMDRAIARYVPAGTYGGERQDAYVQVEGQLHHQPFDTPLVDDRVLVRGQNGGSGSPHLIGSPGGRSGQDPSAAHGRSPSLAGDSASLPPVWRWCELAAEARRRGASGGRYRNAASRRAARGHHSVERR